MVALITFIGFHFRNIPSYQSKYIFVIGRRVIELLIIIFLCKSPRLNIDHKKYSRLKN